MSTPRSEIESLQRVAASPIRHLYCVGDSDSLFWSGFDDQALRSAVDIAQGAKPSECPRRLLRSLIEPLEKAIDAHRVSRCE